MECRDSFFQDCSSKEIFDFKMKHDHINGIFIWRLNKKKHQVKDDNHPPPCF
jgi:hypothetical protein